jgi:Reverse transcriptase (RNA-dependent DNA polymerase)
MLIIYVDDMIIIGNDKEETNMLKERLCREFEMKILGDFKYFFGMEVTQNKEGFFLSQGKYST